jgi:aminopeptidase N
MVLYVQLESMLGRDAVLAGIAAFLKDPGAKSVKDLEAALAAASGKDLSAYFDAWVFGAGIPEWPTFLATTSQNGDQVTVTLTQMNASKKIYGCSVEVDVSGATQTGTAVVDFGIAPSSAMASATVTLAETVTGAVIDPRHRVVAKDAKSKPKAKDAPKHKVWIL